MDGTVIFIAVFLGLIPAAIASNKGHNFLVWWFFGAALFIVALPLAIMLKPNTNEIEQSQIQSGEMKKCPYCAELIKKDAVICRYCGRELPTINSLIIELQEITTINKTNPTEINKDEILKWKAGFSQIGWLESIGQNTKDVLSSSYSEITRDPPLCITYADTRGSRIVSLSFNQTDMFSEFTALIATSEKLFFVRPDRGIVNSLAYKDISKVERGKKANSKAYRITSNSGDTVILAINYQNTVDENLFNLFLERITLVR